ncbi:hypothetical protein M2454_000773 [Aequitasia blattaphilus]|uniref:Uncharacterized protein n=1 Tax=Aequitasia blattaphilus TaxID=2949332 RepID=A0ABT1E826_9FIRM|nr:hypothetical protein [Aequitasia blattaphilus]MCP1101980.1 hypothetical protein [Aequitasia blattaphilus]MCR8614620.1 hypothetical protein [Aequitasia blattaphilus]
MDKLMDILTGFLMGPAFSIGNLIWQFLMGMVTGVMTTSPSAFSQEAWDYVRLVLYPWAQSIGIALLNTWFFIGFIKQNTDLKQNFTFEVFVKLCINVIAANALILGMIRIIHGFFWMASALTGQVLHGSSISFSNADLDVGTWAFFAIFGFIYVLVALICGGMIFLTVYSRYIKILFMVATGPIALSTIAGGQGISNTAIAWVKTFLGYLFEIVAIAIVLTIGSKLIHSINWMTGGALDSYMNGFWGAIQSLITMIILAASVKGTDGMLRRAFAL